MSVDLSKAVKSDVACAVPSGTSPAASASEQYFATDHLLADFRQRTISSGLVTRATQGAQSFVNLAYIMVLARLLVPQEFGLVVMVTTVMGFVRIFQDAGLSTATVQCEVITEAQTSTLFGATSRCRPRPVALPLRHRADYTVDHERTGYQRA